MTKKRFVALDVLRGLTIAFMCIVNHPGTWSKVFPPLLHSTWDGCTPTDLVYPFFIFCMGVSMAFSFSRYEGLSAPAFRKIAWRSVLIFLIGFLLNIFPFYPIKLHDTSASFGQNYLYWMQHWRIMGVLQRIALSYLLAGVVALLCRKDVRRIILIGLGMMTLYTAVLLVAGDLTLEGNIAGKIDVALFGADHNYKDYGIPFEPENLLGTLTGACTALLGFVVGTVVRGDAKGGAGASKTIAKLLFYGLCLLAASRILNIWIPINKPLWSASYVLYSGGWAMIGLGAVSYLVDVLGCEKAFVPAKAMGMNALLAYIISTLIGRIFRVFQFFPGKMWFAANEWMSLLYALLYTLVVFIIIWILYKRRIFFKL